MKREEAIKNLESIIDWMNMAIEALQQQEEYITKMDEVRKAYDNINKAEPCDDCVSRQDLLEKAWDADTRVGFVQVVDVGDIKDAPPVHAEPRTGHWIECEDEVKVFCSECKEVSDYPTMYCPNCGAKMEEQA